MIYVLGDEHVSTEECGGFARSRSWPLEQVAVEDLLSQTLDAQPNLRIDLFFEIRYYHNEDMLQQDIEGLLSLPNTGYMVQETFQRFRACVSTDKRRCPWRNLRLHYSDPRSIFAVAPAVDPRKYPEASQLFALHRLLLALYRGLTEVQNSRMEWEAFQRSRDWRADAALLPTEEQLRDPRTFHMRVTPQLSELTKVDKQIRRIADPQVRRVIQEGLERALQSKRQLFLPEQVRVAKTLASVVAERETPLLPKIMEKALSDLFEAHSLSAIDHTLLLDAYVLGRLFKNIDPPVCNAVIFAGDVHAQVMRSILRDLNMAELAFPAVGKQCIDVSAMRFPLFDRDFHNMPPCQ